jgi:hypothetical protein
MLLTEKTPYKQLPFIIPHLSVGRLSVMKRDESRALRQGFDCPLSLRISRLHQFIGFTRYAFREVSSRNKRCPSYDHRAAHAAGPVHPDAPDRMSNTPCAIMGMQIGWSQGSLDPFRFYLRKTSILSKSKVTA